MAAARRTALRRRDANSIDSNDSISKSGRSKKEKEEDGDGDGDGDGSSEEDGIKKDANRWCGVFLFLLVSWRRWWRM
jgi:hypothetical protein